MTRLSLDQQGLRDHLLRYSIRRSGAPAADDETSLVIDTTQTTARPEGMLLVAKCLLDLLPNEVTAIGGSMASADLVAFATAGVAAGSGRMLKAFSIRDVPPEPGSSGINRIVGPLEPYDSVAIVDDGVTNGTSPENVARIVSEFGATPIMIVSIIDRNRSTNASAAGERPLLKAILSAPDLGLTLESRDLGADPNTQ